MLEPAVGGLQGPGAPVDHHGGHDVAACRCWRCRRTPSAPGGCRQVQHLLPAAPGCRRSAPRRWWPAPPPPGRCAGPWPAAPPSPPAGGRGPRPCGPPGWVRTSESSSQSSGVHGQQDLLGQDGPGQVVLGGQGGEHLRLRLLRWGRRTAPSPGRPDCPPPCGARRSSSCRLPGTVPRCPCRRRGRRSPSAFCSGRRWR